MQHSLDDEVTDDTRALVRIIGGPRALTPAQQTFNRLVERIGQQRQELADWKAFGQSYHEQLTEHYQPALARLREQQRAMARLLDGLLEGQFLDRRERAKTRQILLELLSQMLGETPEPDLVALYDRHAERPFEDEQQETLARVRELAGEELGVPVDAIPEAESAEELAQWIESQLNARDETPGKRRTGRKSAKVKARETERAQSVEGGTRAVRELFRKLASELHPDRETDPAEQARKNELMQRVNRAYKAGNLLALLELQLSVEQIDLAGLAALAEERLRHYIFVLEEQSQRLQDEIAECVAPFARATRGVSAQRLTPAIAQKALKADIRQIKALTRGLRQDLALFRDVDAFKEILWAVPVSRAEDPEGDPKPRRRSGRG